MTESNPSSSSEVDAKPTSEGARQLLNLLSQRGYFSSNGNSIIPQLDPNDVDTFEKFESYFAQEKNKKQNIYVVNAQLPEFSLEYPSASFLIPDTSREEYYTPIGLANEIRQQLQNQPQEEQRMAVEDVMRTLNVHEKYLKEKSSLTRLVLQQQQQQEETEQQHGSVQIIEDIDHQEIVVSTMYWNKLRDQIGLQVQAEGLVRVVDLSKRLSLSTEVLMEHLLGSNSSSPSRSTTTLSPSSDTTGNCSGGSGGGGGGEDVAEASLPWTIILQGGAKALVSQSYLDSLESKVLDTFRGLEEPTLVSTVCQDHGGWDQDLVLRWLGNNNNNNNNNNNRTGKCPSSGGELHVDANVTPLTTATAMFVPHTYTEKQRQSIHDFFSVNGYLTVDICSNYGVLPHQMIRWMVEGEGEEESSSTDNNSSVVVLADGQDKDRTVLIANHLVQNVQAVIQECCSSSSGSSTTTQVVDLQDYLPMDIVSQPETIQRLMDHIEFDLSSSSTTTSNKNGVVVATNGSAIFVSQSLVSEILQTVLPPVITRFAKSQAEKLNKEALSLAALEDETPDVASSSRKGGGGISSSSSNRKRKGKKEARKSPDTIQHSADSRKVVPLLQVAGAIVQACPDLLLEGTEQDLLDNAEHFSWEDDNDDDDNNELGNDSKVHSGLLIIEFCRKAIYTDEFRSNCHEAIRAECKRLQSLRESKASLSRKEEAATVRSIEASFEEVFVSLCRMIQVVVKFYNNVLSSDSQHVNDEVKEALQKEILLGCCADLTSRMTQYVLFKNEEEGGIFTFEISDDDPNVRKDSVEHDNRDANFTSLPKYCTPIDTAVRLYPRSYLSCPPPREPLALLRESLPGNVGVSLARLWINCGGESYLGGVRTARDGDRDTFTRPGNLDGFLSHVEENCLTICGLPFKKLDKKTEKQLLFVRRQRLSQMLQATIDPIDVLELTIMLLFQQVKQLVVCGSQLRGLILNLLLDERKISEPVSNSLRALATSVDIGQVDEKLVLQVKQIGLCRDVTKLELET